MAQTPTASPLRAMAEAILAHLRPLADGTSARVRSVRLADRVKRAEDLFASRTPALVLVYAGSPKFTSMSMGASRVAHTARWVVFLAIGSLASEAARIEGTTGDNGEAGLFELIDLVRASLQARMAGSRGLSLVSVDPVVETPAVSVWGFRIETVDEESASEAADTRARLTSIDGSIPTPAAGGSVHVPTT